MPETAPAHQVTQLQKLSPKHKEVLSLIAQGVARGEVAEITEFTPEYISWLLRQEVCQGYLQEIREYVDFRLHAMTGESVDAIQDTLRNGASDDRLKAAKLQLETVGVIGSGKLAPQVRESTSDHLAVLATRLVELLHTSHGKVYDGQSTQSETIVELSNSESTGNV
jgi:hypothetical protein